MKSLWLNSADGHVRELPLFDPVVAAHVHAASSYVDVLMNEINVRAIYAPLFAGREHLTFLDIGANMGLVSLYAGDTCDRIVALEPSPDVFPVLRALTFKYPKIEPVRAALAPADGPVEFYVNDVNSTASSTVNTYGNQITVQGLRLSSILRIYQLEHVDIAKFDAEGAEGESLTFEELKIASPIIDKMFIEFHNCPRSTWEFKLGQIVQHLSELGYHKQYINGMALTASK